MTETTTTYNTFERKIIYAFSVLNENGDLNYYNGLRKIGDASITNLKIDQRDESEDLKAVARKRIKQYAGTSGLPYNIEISRLAMNKEFIPFRDYDVHDVLKRSGIDKVELGEGNEWYRTDIPTIIKAIEAVENGRSSITATNSNVITQINFRPEQEQAIRQTNKVFKSKEKMLWNAKMRFGKTLAALQVVKANQFKKTLIITHRPVVSDGWFDDFVKIFKPEDNYLFGSKNNKGERINFLSNCNKPFIYFASMQDLRGLDVFGGTHKTENEAVANIDWDFVIIDEAHEGTRTEIAEGVLKVVTKEAKLLELSGTPFNILDDYDEDQVFTWDYVMEQEAKSKWNDENPDLPNPYRSLPKVNMFTFELQKKFTDVNFISLEDKAFNFMEFFKVNQEGKFIYESKVNTFLDEITKNDSKTNYPFSTAEFRDNLRHTLWLLPSVASCKALKVLLDNHRTFKGDYSVINIVDDGREDGTNDSDLKRVRNAITSKPSETRTITLSVRKLTTGVNIPEWTGVVFLNNTNSPSSYLQAAFRAQTPFNDEVLGEKTNAYIFDFAPDRALTIMCSAARLDTGVGKKTTRFQREEMQKFINFLPIIGESGNGMQSFNVDSLLTKLKKVYAEKAVRTGFDDDSLYNDELLTLTQDDLDAFKDLQEIVGKTIKSKLPKNLVVTENGLDEEEYERGERAKKKPPRERTKEEQEAIDKIKKAKKQRKTLISILRGISIRIPMMIYGMDLDVDADVDIDKFVDEVDIVSWNEFMPKGVTKEIFKRYAKFYDPEVFIEAGRIIRGRVKSFDTLEYSERTEKIGELFGTFKNPDKETVLTPWRIVNLQLSSTIGGLCYFDSNFQNSTFEGKSSLEWIENEMTATVFEKGSKILEINSKTGLYPLYAATSLYYKIRDELNTERAGVFDKFDEERIISKVLKDNIFVIAKTPMAKTITKRTLAGYSDMETNIHYIENITDKIKENSIEMKNELFGGEELKFDVIIGNPPYQEMDGGAQASASPIYHHFVRFAKELNPEVISLIIPTRWYAGGKGLDDFRDEMLNDIHLRELHDWLTPEDIFPNTNIRGGVCYFLMDKNYDNSENNTRVVTYENNKVINDVVRPMKIDRIGIFIRDSKAIETIQKIFSDQETLSMQSCISSLRPFGFRGYFVDDEKFRSDSTGLSDPIKCFGRGMKVGYLERDEVTIHPDWINRWKVYTPRANNVGTELSDDNLNTFVGTPETICTESYLVIGAELGLNEESCNNISKYLKTKFVRYLHGLAKGSQDATAKTYRFVPMQDFSKDSKVDWSVSVSELDKLLYSKYNLSSDAIENIENRIKEMK